MKKLFLFTILLLSIVLRTNAQNDTVIQIEEKIMQPQDEVFMIVEEMPEYPGGQTEMMKFIASNIDYYKLGEVSGKIFVRFVVSNAGKVVNPEIIRGGDKAMEEEAIRVINKMPQWKPGKMRGQPVSVYFIVPINFATY